MLNRIVQPSIISSPMQEAPPAQARHRTRAIHRAASSDGDRPQYPHMLGPGESRVLHVVGCAAPPVLEVRVLIEAAQQQGWDTCLVLSPAAARWLDGDLPALTELTGHPVLSDPACPGEAHLPRATAVLVAPATANTINKWTAGISDTRALGVISQAISRQLPVVMLPCLDRDWAHPAFAHSLSVLRESDVHMVWPGLGPRRVTAGEGDPAFAWQAVLDAVSVAWQSLAAR